MKKTLAIFTLAAAVFTAGAAQMYIDVEADFQQLQTLRDIRVQQGADLDIRVRPKVGGAWLPLTGYTATWQARQSMTSTNYYGADSAWTSNALRQISIPLDSNQTGDVVTNWVYVVSLLKDGNVYPLGTGSYTVVESTFTGAGTLLSDTNQWATRAWVLAQGYTTEASAGDITAVAVEGGLLTGGGTNGAVTVGLTTNAVRDAVAGVGYLTNYTRSVVAAGSNVVVNVQTNGSEVTYTVSAEAGGGSTNFTLLTLGDGDYAGPRALHTEHFEWNAGAERFEVASNIVAGAALGATSLQDASAFDAAGSAAAVSNALGELAFEDWPASDGEEYVAKNGAWAVATPGGGTVTSVSGLGYTTNSGTASDPVIVLTPAASNLVAGALQAEADTLQDVVTRGGAVTSGVVTIDSTNARTNTFGGIKTVLGVNVRGGGDLSSVTGDYGAMALGYSAGAGGDYGATAFGYGTTANGDYGATALGSTAYAINDSAFAWSGTTNTYVDNGPGTFNIDPVGGVDGVYIGTTNLATLLSAGGISAATATNIAEAVYSDPSMTPSNLVITTGTATVTRAHSSEIVFNLSTNAVLTFTLGDYPTNAVHTVAISIYRPAAYNIDIDTNTISETLWTAYLARTPIEDDTWTGAVFRKWYGQTKFEVY